MTQILLVGATGYVGGTVLSFLFSSPSPTLSNLSIAVLVRRPQQAEKLRAAYGTRIRTVQWLGLHDPDSIEQIAASYDIIINAGTGFVAEGAKAFVGGLARRIGGDHPVPWLIHTSGCTNLVDLKGNTGEWDDGRDGEAVFEFLKALDEKDSYPQRTAEIKVLDTAARKGVQAVSVQAPLIFGEGEGLFNWQGVVVPLVMR